MKKSLLLAGTMTTSALFSLAAMPAMAAEATATVDLNSAYVSKGRTYNDGLVIQPGIDVAIFKGFYVAAWANIDLNDYGTVDAGDFSEVDLVAGYRTNLWEKVELDISIAEYVYPVDDGNEAEITAGYNIALGKGFFVFGNVIYNVDVIKDFYASLGLGYTHQFSEATSLTLKGKAGCVGSDWAGMANEGKEGGLNEYLLTLGVNHAVTDAFSVNAHLNYTDNLDSNVLPDEAIDIQWFGGVGLAYSF